LLENQRELKDGISEMAGWGVKPTGFCWCCGHVCGKGKLFIDNKHKKRYIQDHTPKAKKNTGQAGFMNKTLIILLILTLCGCSQKRIDVNLKCKDKAGNKGNDRWFYYEVKNAEK